MYLKSYLKPPFDLKAVYFLQDGSGPCWHDCMTSFLQIYQLHIKAADYSFHQNLDRM